jgi:deoxyuridine 5'-triphosphate nucleotidohydrolase
LKSAGRKNPNCTYFDLDDSLFADVDTEGKAYLLGWIASDGAIKPGSINLFVNRRDFATLGSLRDIACPQLPLRMKRTDLAGFTIDSGQIVRDVCRLLDIRPGKKDAVVGFPKLRTDELRWAFVRGYFDGDGAVSSLRTKGGRLPYPICSISSTSRRLLEAINDFCGIPASLSAGRIEWSGNNALDFLARLYDGASFFLQRKRDLYLDWRAWVPGLGGRGNHGGSDLFRWVKTAPNAQAPHKSHASDSGFDLTLIAKKHSHGPVEFYGTGIKIQPAYGWYFDLVPRSSIAKSGYLLANSIGVIDRTYVGEILVPLIKYDPGAPDLELPARIIQIVPRPIVHVEIVEVSSLEETRRGTGGFGSTTAHAAVEPSRRG